MNSLSIITWNKFKRNPLGVIGLTIIAISCFVSIIGYLILPDSTPYSNKMNLEIAKQPPGFTTDILFIPNDKEKEVGLLEKMIFGQASLFSETPISSYRKSSDTLYYFGFDGVHENFLNNASYKIASRTYFLGTDVFGRDLLSRILIGTRVSLSVGFISVFISLFIGVFLGALAAYFRGRVDAVVMWLINVIWSIPTLLLVIAITLALGKGFWQVFVAVGLSMWVEVARIVRGEVLSIKENQYVEAATSLGYGHVRILLKHILPNVMGAIIVISAANLASAILIEAGLSFLGLGAQPPLASWGTMIRDHYAFIVMGKSYLAIYPGIAIMLLVLSFVLLGNAIRDALDVKN